MQMKIRINQNLLSLNVLNFIFLKHTMNDQNIDMPKNETWINESDIVEELPFPEMTHLIRENQYKFDSDYD